jgi:hypothetical protein
MDSIERVSDTSYRKIHDEERNDDVFTKTQI